MSVIELSKVSVRYHRAGRPPVQALQDVDISIAAGETLGVVGESGSGKSTLATIALGLRKPTTGSVQFLGAPYTKRARSGQMQAVLQHPAWSLNPRLAVWRSIAEPLQALRRHSTQKLSKPQLRDQVTSMLSAVRLGEDIAERLPHELSGGQRQRVSIARALITNPTFIVFDEAVSALDMSVQAEILQLIVRLQHEHRFAALFISHDLEVVRFLSDHVAVMQHGKIVETATIAQFNAGPQHPYSQSLVEARS